LLNESIPALDQFFQPLGEARCRSAIDDIVIKTDRHTQIFPYSYVPINDTRLLTDATQRNHECWGGWRDAPTCTFPKHANCRYAHSPPVLLLHLWIRSTYPEVDPKEGSEEKGRQEQQPIYCFETLQDFCHWFPLGCPDLVMNLAEGLAIGCSDGILNGWHLASHIALNRGRHIHIIKQDEVLAAFATCLHGFVLTHCLSQAGNDERRERQGLPSFRFLVPQERARPGHIDFDQAMNHGLVLGGTIRDRHPPRIFGYGITL